MVDSKDLNKYTLSHEIEEQVFDFISEVFTGIETKVYLSKEEKEGNFYASDLTSQKAMLYGMNLLEFYLNGLYKTLVDKSDEFMVEKFTSLGKLVDYHPVYVLNIITNVIMKTYPLCPRSKFKIESKEVYLDSVKACLSIMKKYILTLFNDDLTKLNSEKKKENDKGEGDN